MQFRILAQLLRSIVMRYCPMSTINESFEQSFAYFRAHESEILKMYEGKIVAIYIDRILGTYPSKTNALLTVPRDFDIAAGSFLIKDLSQGVNSTVRIYQSNVHFEE